MPKRKVDPAAKLWCFKCRREVTPLRVAGGSHCPFCSAYLQLKRQPTRAEISLLVSGTPEDRPG
jgi:DNA-directed RNA polymerase subunit RPC12/RpoP